MRLTETLITSEPVQFIVPGRVVVDREIEGAEVGQHDYLLLTLPPIYPRVYSPRDSMRVAPVSYLERLPSGLCSVQDAPRSFLFPMLGQLLWASNPAQPQNVSWKSADAASYNRPPGTAYGSRDGIIADLSARFTPEGEGVRFYIEGVISPFENSVGRATASGAFSIEGIVPWPALILRRVPIGASALKFIPREKIPQNSTRIDAIPITNTIGDLLFLAHPGQVCVAGHLAVLGHEGGNWSAHPRMVKLFVEQDALKLDDVSSAFRSGDGFTSVGSAGRSLGLDRAGLIYLQQSLHDRAEAVLNLTGNEIGKLHWRVGLGDEPSQGRDIVHQHIRSCILAARLDHAGLTLTFQGKLEEPGKDLNDGFTDADWKRITPASGFEASAHLPWLLLAAWGSPLAKRQSDF